MPTNPSPMSIQNTAIALDESRSTISDSTKTPTVSRLIASTPLPKPGIKKVFSSPVSTAALNADLDIASLLRAQRELENQLRGVKEELETAEQARKIERDSRKNDPDGEIDAELIELVEKWRAASRQAAEELFGKVLDRVNRMGGPRAWKEQQKKQQEFQNSWDQEDQQAINAGGSDDDDEGRKDVEKRDIYAEYGIDPETENEKSQRAKGIGDTGELPGQEDASICLRFRRIYLYLYHRSLHWL